MAIQSVRRFRRRSTGTTTLATETWPGANGAAWPAQWTNAAGTGTATVNGSNRGLQVTPAVAYGTGLTEYLSGMTAVADSETSISLYPSTTAEHYSFLNLRSGGTLVTGDSMTNNGYYVACYPGTIEVGRAVAGTVTTLGTLAYTFSTTVGTNLKVSLVGAVVRVRAWQVGATEPSTWNVYDATDGSPYLTAGKVMLTAASGNAATATTTTWGGLTVTTPPGSGGGGGGTSSTTYLPFDMPTRATLAASSKKVWVHWMGGAFPISVDNKNGATDSTEYWRQYWMPPGTTEGAGQSWATNHNVYGGLVRERKQTRAPLSTATRPFEVQDYMTEVNQVIAAGMDGFTSEILSVPTTGNTNPQRWAQINQLLDAADIINDSTFTLTLMPDSNALNGSTVTDVVNALDTLSTRRVTRLNGRLVVAPYSPETLGLTFWTNVINGLVAKGHNPVFWPCYESAVWSTGQAPTFNGIAYAHSRWGVRDPVSSASTSNDAAGAPAYCHTTYSKPWMQPVSVGDQRPNQGVYTEQRNADQIVASWMAAINAGADCDWVQIPTWDDFAEGAEVCPTQTSGYFWLDISAYFLCKYKTGTWPTIVRDAIYLNHRRQPATGVTYTGGQTQFQTLTGGTSTSNQVEALVFATAATGTVSLTVAGSTTTFDLSTMTAVAPGVYSCKKALAAGSTSATLVRSGTTVASVTGPVTIATSQVSQDMAYYGKSSLR